MKIYSTRHGETAYNKEGRVLGVTDLPLNETGITQAAGLAEHIAELGDVDIIIASPLKRAQQTAGAVAERCGLQIITDKRLREWDYGDCEGRSYSTAQFGAKKREFGVRMGETGESLLQLAHRVYSAIDDIIENYGGKTVLIVSHGGVCRMIETYFHNMTQQEFSGWFMGNCQVIEYNT